MGNVYLIYKIGYGYVGRRKRLLKGSRRKTSMKHTFGEGSYIISKRTDKNIRKSRIKIS